MLPYIITYVLFLTAFFAWFYVLLTLGDAFYTLYKNVQDFVQIFINIQSKILFKVPRLI